MRTRGHRLPAVRRFALAGLLVALLAPGCAGPGAGDGAAAEQDAGAPPALILISLDGFRWDYQQLTDTPNLDALAQRGVQAEGLIPVFPSKTFPSHYSMVTGLRPGEHGIISNNMRDPGWEGDFRLGTDELTKGRWWGGEPFWTTANKNGLVTAAYFWPGSDVLINNDRPNYFHPYDGSVPYEDRVDRVLAWLDLAGGERPSFITLYFADPNDTSHDVGPEAPETLAAVRRVDAMVGRLVGGLQDRGLLATTNIVVTADHGMALMDRQRDIRLGEFVQLLPDEVFEAGAFLQIYPEAGREDLILEALRGAHPRLAVYGRDEIPARYHLAGHPRLAPIVGVPDVGWSVSTRETQDEPWARFLLGNHGGDPQHPDMHGVFIAAGPSFAEGVRVAAFENIEIYNLMASALRIEPAPNQGDLNRLTGVLR